MCNPESVDGRQSMPKLSSRIHELCEGESTVTLLVSSCDKLREWPKQVGILALRRIEEQRNGHPGVLARLDHNPVLHALELII